MYGSRPVRSRTVSTSPPRSGMSATTAVNTWSPSSSPIVSPAMRCQMRTRSRPRARSIQGIRAASSRPVIADTEVRMPDSDADPRQKPSQPEESVDHPSLTAHTPVTTARRNPMNTATSESTARVTWALSSGTARGVGRATGTVGRGVRVDWSITVLMGSCPRQSPYGRHGKDSVKPSPRIPHFRGHAGSLPRTVSAGRWADSSDDRCRRCSPCDKQSWFLPAARQG